MAKIPAVRASKLEPLRLRADALQRERLLARLAGADTPIVLIAASAGYGKSTLAAQWSTQCQRPVAWLNLDRTDNDPIVFLNAVAHALDRLDPVAPELLDEFTALMPRVSEVVLPGLAVELNRLSPVELILDDVQELTEPQCLAALDFLLEEVPSESQVVLVTRAQPELPLARRRAAAELFEIHADELALDADETLALAESSGSHLSEQALEWLRERTEGWPAGVVLALRALPESASSDDIAKTISRTQREIAEYAFEVLLHRETAERRRFLLATSVLTKMTAPLCDTILGITNSSKLLADLERSNSFVIELDDNRGWYRYHNLFAEFLRSELDRADPDLATTSLSRAAYWHEQEGSDPAEAFRYAHECGDLKLAGRVAMASADDHIRRGRIATMKLWLDDCTDEEVSGEPQLAIVAAWLHFHFGDRRTAERFTAAAAKGDLDVTSTDGTTSLRSSLLLLRATLAPSGVDQMLADAQFVCAAEGRAANTRWLLDGVRAVGNANLLLGRPDEAVAAFREAVELTTGHPEASHVKIACLGFLAFALTEAGSWPTARKSAQEATAVSAAERLEQTLLGGIALTARAMVLLHDGDFDRAAADLTSARRTGHLVGGARWFNADMNIRWGNISLDLGDRPAAQEHAETARAALHGYPDPGTLTRRLAELAGRVGSLADLDLTPAEIRILPFLPTHLSVKEVAERLHVSPATVKTHVSSVYAKLGATSRSDAVAKMEELGLQPATIEHEHAADIEPS